jgi:DHA1 family bicyclomycin/chloramphenicol resistance-like MFS transporter
MALNVYQLIIFRVFQAIGSGATVSVAMAVIKDLFDGKQRAQALSFTATLTAIAPIVAPLICGMILQIVSWRGVFGVLAGFCAIAFTCCQLMRDTAKHLEKKIHDALQGEHAA